MQPVLIFFNHSALVGHWDWKIPYADYREGVLGKESDQKNN